METEILFNTVKLIPWSVLLQLSIVSIIALILKRYYDNFASYFMFRANKDLGKNVKVIVNGHKGYITFFTWRFIYVMIEDSKNELVIPISRWTTYTWIVCRNGKNVCEKEDI